MDRESLNEQDNQIGYTEQRLDTRKELKKVSFGPETKDKDTQEETKQPNQQDKELNDHDENSDIDDFEQKVGNVQPMEDDTIQLISEAKATRRDANLRMDFYIDEGYDYSSGIENVAPFKIKRKRGNDSDDEDYVYPLSIRYNRKKDVSRSTIRYI